MRCLSTLAKHPSVQPHHHVASARPQTPVGGIGRKGDAYRACERVALECAECDRPMGVVPRVQRVAWGVAATALRAGSSNMFHCFNQSWRNLTNCSNCRSIFRATAVP
jgi:hypothetical protein